MVPAEHRTLTHDQHYSHQKLLLLTMYSPDTRVSGMAARASGNRRIPQGDPAYNVSTSTGKNNMLYVRKDQ